MIRDLSETLSITPKTLRFYEEIGLIPKPSRNSANYRVYSPKDVKVIDFVKKARNLGMSIEDIKEILSIRQKGDYPCEKVISLLEEKIIEIDQKIKEALEFKKKLENSVKDFKENYETGQRGDVCGFIENMFE